MDLSGVLLSLGQLTSEAIAVVTPVGKRLEPVWSNPAFDKLVGDEVEIPCLLSCLLGDDPGSVDDILVRVEGGDAFETRIVCRDAHDLSYRADVRFCPTGDESPLWLVFIAPVLENTFGIDIRDDLALVAESTDDMIAILSRAGQILWANQSFWNTTQYTFEELSGLGMEQLISLANPGDELAEGLAKIVEALSSGHSASAEVLCKRKDETRYWADISIEPICDKNGEVRKFLCTTRDITEQKSEYLIFNTLFDESSSAMILKRGNVYMRANETFLDQIGMTSEELNGMRTSDLYDPETAREFEQIEAKVLRTGRAYHNETETTTKDGRSIHHVTKRFRIYDQALDEYLLGIVGMDVTDIRRAQRETEAAKRASDAAEQRLWAAVDALTDGFILTDKDDNLVLVNQAFRDLHGPAGALIELNKPASEGVKVAIEAGIWDLGGLSKEEYLKNHMDNRQAIPEGGDIIRLADGRWLMRREITLPNGEVVGLRIDVSNVKKNEEALANAQMEAEQAQIRLVEAIEALDDAFVLFDDADKLVLCNQKFRNLYSDALTDLEVGTSFAEIERLKSRADVLRPDPSGKQAENTPPRHVDEALTDGRHLSIRHRKTSGKDTVGLYVDVTTLKKQQETLELARSDMEYASLHDSLTDLANRRYLDQTLKAGQQEGRPFGVLHIDLDRFKQINDTLGHHAGDQILVHVARILNSCTDIEDFAARVGGDEFVVIVWGPESTQDLIDIAERLINKMSRPFYFNGHECRFGCSVGIFVADAGLEDPQQALINADIALYKAKSEGRGRYAVFSQALQVEIMETKQIADALLYGLEVGEFVAYYQPQVDARTRELVGAEALVRWNSRTLGTKTPDKFLTVAEGLNVVASVDRAVLQNVAADLASWRADGLLPPCISVNISSQRLLSDELVKDLKAFDFKPEQLSIELLESIFLDNERDIAKWRLDQIREMGFKLELDDFGTGHASILSLLKLEPARLKIDRQFITPIVESKAKANLVRSIIEIGRSIDVGVVAEGVETKEHADLLAKLGCDVLQGYYFAKPMPSYEFKRFLENNQMGPARMVAGE